ncbi:MAG: hypothetical protein AAF636_15770 [Pseudomonadota bacterium]
MHRADLVDQSDVFLQDAPTGSIDPVVSDKIDNLMMSLRQYHAVLTVPHSITRAGRVANRIAWCHLGELRKLVLT